MKFQPSEPSKFGRVWRLLAPDGTECGRIRYSFTYNREDGGHIVLHAAASRPNSDDVCDVAFLEKVGQAGELQTKRQAEDFARALIRDHNLKARVIRAAEALIPLVDDAIFRAPAAALYDLQRRRFGHTRTNAGAWTFRARLEPADVRTLRYRRQLHLFVVGHGRCEAGVETEHTAKFTSEAAAVRWLVLEACDLFSSDKQLVAATGLGAQLELAPWERDREFGERVEVHHPTTRSNAVITVSRTGAAERVAVVLDEGSVHDRATYTESAESAQDTLSRWRATLLEQGWVPGWDGTDLVTRLSRESRLPPLM